MDRSTARGLVSSSGKGAAPHVPSSPYRGLVESPAQREGAAKEAADLNQAERMQLAKEGKALPDGSFPIRNVTDLKKARIRAHQANDPGAAERLIRKREKDLGVNLGPIGSE